MAFNPVGYIKESKQELSRIIWPTRKETLRFSVIVILASVIIGTYIASIDFVLTTLADKFLYK